MRYLARNLLPLTAVIAAAYVAALLPVLFLTVRSATYGSIDLAVLLSGMLGLVAFIAGGWLLGLIMRSAFAAPVAFALAMVTTFLGYSGDTFAATAPVLHVSPTLGYHESAPLVWFRIAFLVVVVAVIVATADGVLGRRQFKRLAPRPGRVALWLLPVGLAVVATANTPALFAPDSDAPRVCQTEAGVEFCVHQGHRTQLAAMVDAVTPTLALVGGPPALPFDRIYDRSLRASASADDREHTFFYDLSATLDVSTSRSEIVAVAAGLDGCQSRFELDPDQDEVRNMWMLAQRLDGDRSAGADSRFGDLSDTQLKAWLAANRPSVDECAITGDLLP
ncbi:hypothetical protein ACQPZJ_06370 [Actinoplanes sp. CA-054009]